MNTNTKITNWLSSHKSVPILLTVTLVLIVLVFFVYGKRRTALESAIQVRQGPVVESVYGLGTVLSSRTFNLKLGVTSSIRTILVSEGDLVKKGQALISFDLGMTAYAPFKGTVTAVKYKNGETVFPQMNVLTIQDLTDRYVQVSLEQNGALRVKPKQKAFLIFEEMRSNRISGEIKTIYPDEGQFLVNITVNDLPPSVLPGMTADVAIEVGKKENALLVPTKAIMGGQVIRIRNGKRSKIQIVADISDGEWTEVIDGDLVLGDSVIPRR